MRISRRQFLASTAATAAAAVVPSILSACGSSPSASQLVANGIFLVDAPGKPRRSTCEALCARLFPTGHDPATDPGASEAGAVGYIDMFLSAFELPAEIADNPAIWLAGRFSGRNPYPDNVHGTASARYPADDFESGERRHFLALTPLQELSWRALLYGGSALSSAGWASAKWRRQVGDLIPAASTKPLRDLYAEGLDAFDLIAHERHGRSLAVLPAEEIDALIGEAITMSAGGGSFYGATPTTLGRPPVPGAAVALVPTLMNHTYEGCLALPEYGGNRDRVIWKRIGWRGDTMPLGFSVYDESAAAPGLGPNAGFGDPATYQSAGAMREVRPVSTMGTGS